jgi:hypothetical protein
MNKVYRKILLHLGLLLCITSSVNGQLSDWQFGGYAKDLLTYADAAIAELPFEIGRWQNTAQVRLNLFWYPTENTVFSLQSRNVLVNQSNIKSLQQFQDELVTSSYYYDLKWDWLKKEDVSGYSEIDRLHFNWILEKWEIILGRQRITWGTCLVWNPTDFFNPFDILDFDYEERPGTDALHLQYYTGPISQFNLAITPGRTRYDVIYAGRYMTNHWNYDFNFIIGWQRNSLRLATSWAGEIYDGGFRGEVLFTNPNIRYSSLNLDPTSLFNFYVLKEINDLFWTVALSYDYTFENSFYTHTEYLYNGLGTTKNAGFRRFDVIFTGELTPARHSIFQEFAYQISPLLRCNFFIIFNPSDKSWIAAPSIQYSLATNWELYLIAFPSGGEKGTEYGGFPSQYFARIKFSF